MDASAIIDAIRDTHEVPEITLEEHNRREAEREVEMLLRGEGKLYRYAPFTTK